MSIFLALQSAHFETAINTGGFPCIFHSFHAGADVSFWCGLGCALKESRLLLGLWLGLGCKNSSLRLSRGAAEKASGLRLRAKEATGGLYLGPKQPTTLLLRLGLGSEKTSRLLLRLGSGSKKTARSLRLRGRAEQAPSRRCGRLSTEESSSGGLLLLLTKQTSRSGLLLLLLLSSEKTASSWLLLLSTEQPASRRLLLSRLCSTKQTTISGLSTEQPSRCRGRS
jgi:hypothetical protein